MTKVFLLFFLARRLCIVVHGVPQPLPFILAFRGLECKTVLESVHCIDRFPFGSFKAVKGGGAPTRQNPHAKMLLIQDFAVNARVFSLTSVY